MARVSLERISQLPLARKAALAAILLLPIVGGFVYYVYLPMQARLQTLDVALTELKREIGVTRAIVARLAELKALNAAIQRRLAELQAQLPPEPEIPALLRKVADLGIETGLNLTLWKPEARRQSPSGLYVELPVTVEALADYHTAGMFFDQVSRLPRIVNATSLKMGEAKTEGKQALIKLAFTAIAFAAPSGVAKGP